MQQAAYGRRALRPAAVAVLAAASAAAAVATDRKAVVVTVEVEVYDEWLTVVEKQASSVNSALCEAEHRIVIVMQLAACTCSDRNLLLNGLAR